MSDYHAKIADRDDVELIHISLDHQDSAGEKWALQENFPWPTVLRSQMSEELAARVPDVVPSYILVKADGTILATEKEAAFSAIAQ